MNRSLSRSARAGACFAPGGSGGRPLCRCASAVAVRLALIVAGASAARAFEVSGFSFNDLHIGSQSSPPSRSYQSRSNSPAPPPAPRETFHAYTAAELARQQAANVARFQQALAQLKPVPPPEANPVASPAPYGELAEMVLADTVLTAGIPVVKLLAYIERSSPQPPAAAPPNLGPGPANAPRPGPPVPIGGVASARGAIFMTVPGGQQRIRLTPGTPVYANSRISTGPGAHLQVLLLDETQFTMGANSDMVMDDFVYDPKTSAGSVVANLSKGVFRFVTAKIARRTPDNMKVRVPTGALGPRGTEFAVALDDAAGHGAVRLYYGQLEVTDQRSGATEEMDSGQKLTLNPDRDAGPPESLDADPTPGELAAAGNALALRRAAAGAGSADDREFLNQQAAFALAGGAVPVETPAGTIGPEEAAKFLALEADVEVRAAAYRHFSWLRQSLEEDGADATAAAASEQDAKTAYEQAQDAQEALVENRS